MSRVVAGTLLLPNGQPMDNASIYFTAKRTEAVSIIEGANTFFTTNGAGVYSQSVVNGFYAVSIEYIADASGAYTRRWQLGDVFIEDGATTTLEALIIASNPPTDLPETLLYEILADAQEAAESAADSANAAAASAASITVGTEPTNIPNITILNTRLGSTGNLGTLAQQNATAVAISGGAVNATSIGNTARSTGKFTELDISGDFLLSGAGKKLLADFTNATFANRAYFETTTPNSVTTVGIKPSGSATGSNVQMHNSSDPANSSRLRLSAAVDAVRIISDSIGSGAVLPIQTIVNSIIAQEISIAGNSGFGVAPDTSCKLQVSNGIKVGNSANSNTNVLDWYEEGTFTPSAVGITSAGVGTYTTREGKYTRIGNIVYFGIVCNWTAHTGTGDLRIDGLPFTSTSTNTNPATAYYDGLTVGAGKQLTCFVPVNAAHVRLISSDPAGGAAANVPMDNSVNLRLSGFYFIN